MSGGVWDEGRAAAWGGGCPCLLYTSKQPWLWIPPGLLIVVLVIAINFIGDALRDALDPNSRN